MRSALWRAVKKAQPTLSDQEIDDLLDRTARQERELVLKHGLNLDQAREIVRGGAVSPGPGQWAGDEEYGPMP